MKFPLKIRDIITCAGISSLAYTVTNGLTSNSYLSGILALSIFIVVAVIWSIVLLWNEKQNCFAIFNAKDWNPATAQLYSPKVNPKETLYLTHFSTSTPSESYTSLLEDKLKDGVHTVRLMSNVNHDGQWTERFKSYKNYKEIHCKYPAFSMDIMIIDDHKLYIFLPTSADSPVFNLGISFDHPKIIQGFKNAFHIISKVHESSKRGHTKRQTKGKN